jgi:hypothetical protein
MQIKYVYSISQLPESIQIALKEAPVFYSVGYERYIIENNGTPLYFYDENYILLFELHKAIVFQYINIPVEYFILNNGSNETPIMFLDACVNELKRKFHIHWINPPFAGAMFGECPSKCLKIPFGNYIVDLTESEESLWLKVHSKHRTYIRRAEKCGVEIKSGREEYLDDYLKIDSETWERSSRKAHQKKFFLDMLETLGKEAIIFMAYQDSIPQGGAVFFYNKVMCYCMYAASKNQPEPGSMNLLHWKAMLDMRDHGVRKYSYVGCRINEDENSKYHSLQHFKKRFGGELKVDYTFKVVTNVIMYKLFRFLIKMKSKEQYKDVIDQEIYKWKDLNN